MPASPDRAPRYLLAGIVGVLIVAGYASTLWLYYPGAKTWDAKYVYQRLLRRLAIAGHDLAVGPH